jgi:SOS-response transcriptional repressor LexA
MSNVVSFPRPTTESITRMKTPALKALRFIENHLAQHGAWPSFDQIGADVGIRSERGVARVVNQLFEANAIESPHPLKGAMNERQEARSQAQPPASSHT